VFFKNYIAMKKLEENKHILIAVKIIFEKKLLNNKWQSHEWEIHDLVLMDMKSGDGYPPINNVEILPLRNFDEERRKSNLKNYFFAEASIDLHRAEAEAYAENLQSSDPAIYIVLREGFYDDEIEESFEDDDIDVHLAEVSLSPYNIQDYEDSGEDIIKKVPLDGPISELLEKFVEQHFKPEEFIKRKRDRARIDENISRGGDQRLKGKNRNYH
tara:strand:+ start:391 stop:1032 length:642 start_codon:yes stop_codon:yes gene_type:complete